VIDGITRRACQMTCQSAASVPETKNILLVLFYKCEEDGKSVKLSRETCTSWREARHDDSESTVTSPWPWRHYRARFATCVTVRAAN